MLLPETIISYSIPDGTTNYQEHNEVKLTYKQLFL